MADSPGDDDFEDYDKPGAERSRRRRGEDDLDSDLESDLLEEDWLTAKKDPSDVSDEELNDDLLQSDEEDQNIGQGVSLNATLCEFDQQVNPIDYPEHLGDIEGGYQQEGGEYVDEYSQPNDMEIPDGQMEYSGEQAGGDGVLDIQINEPLDDEFQVDDYSPSYGGGEQQEEQAAQQEAPEEEEEEEVSQLADTEAEKEPEPKEEVKEEEDEDEEEDDDGESGRLRFKTERKDVTSGVVRLADVATKRRNIPETLELSEEAKADLMEFEEKERQKKQSRFGGRGGDRGGFRGRGLRGRFPGFGMGDFGGGRGRMNDLRLPVVPLHMGMQQSPLRMTPPHHQRHHPHQQHHHQSGPRGPSFQEHGGGPLAQQPLQPLLPLHMAQRGAPVRPQMDPPHRMMSPPPSHNHQQQQQQQQQPKNIHINPHFRGPASSPAQVPLLPPAQSQPRPAVGPQRFPGPGDFQQQHVPGNFGQPPQRPPHHMEPWRNQPPPTPQDRDHFFIGEPGRFPGQQLLMFNHQNPGLLMNSNNHQLPSQGHMAFNQPSPGGFNQPGQGPGGQLGMFQREPPRPNLPPQGHPQSHQGMASLTGHSGTTNTRLFMGHRQPSFPQQQGTPGPFPSQQLQFGMQVRMRGLMQHGLLHSQLQHHDLPLSHQQQQHQQHHRQDLSHPPSQHHSHSHPNEQRQGPMMHHGGGQGQPSFHQQQMQQHGSPRQMHPSGPRPQNLQQRNAPIRPRMSPLAPKVIPQRNSNLRELPVAPGNQNANHVRPASAPNASNVRPVARAMQGGARPGLNPRPVPGGRGRAKAAAQLPGPPERTVVRRDSTGTRPNTAVQDPNEDEETRQYRLKIEEQKRLREEILKRKEMRRQMQASVRKKELLERINGQGDPPQQQQPQHQLQRQFPPKPQQPQQGTTAFPPNGTPQTPPALHQNVKTRLTKGEQAPAPGWQGGQQGRNTGPGGPGPNPHQQAQWQQQHGQQRRNITQLNPIRPGGAPPMGNMPMQGVPMAGLGSGQAQSLGPKSGVKRTVMQRANSGDGAGPQVPQKVRVVKLLGGGGDVSGASAPIQQQATRPAPQLRQGPVRKVTLANPPGQPIHGLVTQGGRGGMGNRVVVPGCGRARGAAGAGGASQLGCGRLIPTRQSQRGAGDSQACTVSIDGLSTSTTDAQLRNLLNSIGPIQMFKMLPQQRKAIAKFHNPQHALSFQVSFNRHMIDLSHIDVSLIDV